MGQVGKTVPCMMCRLVIGCYKPQQVQVANYQLIARPKQCVTCHDRKSFPPRCVAQRVLQGITKLIKFHGLSVLLGVILLPSPKADMACPLKTICEEFFVSMLRKGRGRVEGMGHEPEFSRTTKTWPHL